jgi:hypothetical protein
MIRVVWLYIVKEQLTIRLLLRRLIVKAAKAGSTRHFA